MELDSGEYFFGLLKHARRTTPWWLSIVLTFIFMLVGSLPGAFVYYAFEYLLNANEIRQNSALGSGLLEAVFLIGSYVPIALLVWLWVAVFEERAFGTLGLEKAGAVYKFGRGFFYGFLMFSGAVGVMGTLGYLSVEQGAPDFVGLPAIGGVLVVLFGWLVQGSVEEIVTRGWLMQVIGGRSKPWLGLLLSAVTFALLHGINPNISWLGLLNIFLVGVFYGLFVFWEGGIWGVCGMHAAWNWAQGNVFGLEVSGVLFGGGSLFNFEEAGPDIITGGGFGPEGGLAATGVLLLAVALTIFALRRKTQAGETG